ncbi:PfkB family carbohydrate kinase [uncultured Methanoregula sp.]|uniref:bifunctional heptose 7-phosphate kinase/heptose 1-phosphate adenyltransferase n=1 Tax=uncultured Methanoregula sp. TaxID=1005933 RepID=UPI002AABD7C1|nr:PfkB family carbohydrate kinase [uncultured Methanoregula sp.]
MDSNELDNIIEQFNKTSVLVIGDLMLDRYLSGTMSRISPEAPAPLIDITSESYVCGGAANAIDTICTLGGKVFAVGVVGEDWFGKRLIKLLKHEDVDTKGVIEIKERSTTVKTRVLVEKQQIIRLDQENRQAINESCTKSILDYIHENIERVDAIIISDYNKGVVTNTLLSGAINLAKKFEKPLVVYPKVEPFFDYKGVTIVIIDLEMASSTTGIRYINETSIRNMGQWLLTHLECEFILITDEKEGMSLFEKKGNVTHVPSMVKEVRNVTGTADTVASVIVLSLAAGVTSMLNSTRLANIAAGIILENPERKTVTQEELKRQITIIH